MASDPKTGMYESPHHFGKLMSIRSDLNDLAAQEGCDGEPYNAMQFASDRIAELEAKLKAAEDERYTAIELAEADRVVEELDEQYNAAIAAGEASYSRWSMRVGDALRRRRTALAAYRKIAGGEPKDEAAQACAATLEAENAGLRAAIISIEGWKRPMDPDIEPALEKLHEEMKTCPECIAVKDHPVSRGVCAGGKYRHYEKLQGLLERRDAISDDTTPWPIVQMCRAALSQNSGEAVLRALKAAEKRDNNEPFSAELLSAALGALPPSIKEAL